MQHLVLRRRRQQRLLTRWPYITAGDGAFVGAKAVFGGSSVVGNSVVVGLHKDVVLLDLETVTASLELHNVPASMDLLPTPAVMVCISFVRLTVGGATIGGHWRPGGQLLSLSLYLCFAFDVRVSGPG